MTTIAGPAGQLHVDDGGAGGLPVLLVHSYAGSSAHWKAQLAHLRRRRRALAMDLRGHGRSDAPASGDYSVPALAEDIAGSCRGARTAALRPGGPQHGRRGRIGLRRQNPGRLAGLVLAGSPGKSRGAGADRSWARCAPTTTR